MKLQFYVTSFLLLLGMSVSAEERDSLKLISLDGHESAYALSIIGRIEFDSDSLFLVGAEGIVLGREHKDKIRVVAFTTEGSTEAISTIEVENNIHIYPNPVQQVLLIKGAKIGDAIHIYSLNGNLVYTAKAFDEVTTLDVSGLQRGQYLIQVNALVMKLIKQ